MTTLAKFIVAAILVSIASFWLLGILLFNFFNSELIFAIIVCCSMTLLTVIICTGIIISRIEKALVSHQDQNQESPK